MDTYRVIGLMSGSSLDGLDLACCTFKKEGNSWAFHIVASDVVPYTDEWTQDLKHLPIANAGSFWETHVKLGHYFGHAVTAFIAQYQLQGHVDFIASHGHTVFHFPDKHFTTQVGDGAAIAAIAQLPVVCDFRSTDIALGGQGTPIVPIGDRLLFKNHLFCLNLGGIANISAKTADGMVAFDICAANQVLNLFATKLGKEYDMNGAFAASGKVDAVLLDKLDALSFYTRDYPKSLDNSFTREVVLPCFEHSDLSTEDKLATYTEHIARQISRHIRMIGERERLSTAGIPSMLVTGGGAFNAFLIERIKACCAVEVMIPNDEIVKFKEALVIAFMGVLRHHQEVNVLCSVTGASKDSVGGVIYLP